MKKFYAIQAARDEIDIILPTAELTSAEGGKISEDRGLLELYEPEQAC